MFQKFFAFLAAFGFKTFKPIVFDGLMQSLEDISFSGHFILYSRKKL